MYSYKRLRKTSPTMDTLYFGDIFEQVTSAAGVVERRYYVHSPERTIAVVTRGGAKPGNRYFHVDHLGSVNVVTLDDGSIDERRSNDAYGARRNPEWGGPPIPATSSTTRGYTGHEEDEEFGLVNMKGRMMDPRLGRFTTTDPVIANIWDGQSLNKYSYVGNNPLAFVDPTGFTSEPINIPPEVDYIDQVVHTVYPDGFVPEPIFEPDPDGSLESTSSLRFTSDMGTTGNGAGGLPQDTTEPESSSWRNNPYVNGAGGFGVGLLEGIVPGSALVYDLQDLRGEHDRMASQARIGRSLGQLVGGLAMMGVGIVGGVLGGAATVTGVGTAPGALAVAASTVAVVGGAANVMASIRGLARIGGESSATKTHDHHPFPKFLGGSSNQPTTRMPQNMHEDLHRKLNNFLRDRTNAVGDHMRPQRGNSGADIRNNFLLHERLKAVADFYRQYGDEFAEAARDFFAQYPNLK